MRNQAVGTASGRNTRMVRQRAACMVSVPLCLALSLPVSASEAFSPPSGVKHQLVPILGTTLGRNWEQIGIVTAVDIQFLQRDDEEGFRLYFNNHPGRFSPLAQRAVRQAILRAARAAKLNPASWSVILTFPYPGATMYGESLSAMVGLSVLAMARGDPLPRDRVVTGTITPEGHIGKVGGVPLKIRAAYRLHFQRVLIPEEHDVADGDWETPFLMHVSPVGTISKAYRGLTDQPLQSSVSSVALSASQP